MRKFTATTTHRNQLAILSEVRLTAVSFTLELAYGSVKSAGDAGDFNAISRNAKDAKAEQTARELREG